MELKDEVKRHIKNLIHELSEGNYSVVRKPPFDSRYSPEAISKVIEDYGEIIVDIPDVALDEIDAAIIKGEKTKYTISINLWSEQGRSDLILELTVSEAEKLTIEIDNIHVL